MLRGTRLRLLLVVCLLGGVLGWVGAAAVESVTGRLVPVPWTAAGLLWLLAGGLVIWGLLARPRLKGEGVPMPPTTAMRTAALGMATSRAGAGLLGFYAGLAVALLRSASTPLGGQYLWAALAAAAGGAAVGVAGLWLERICRLPGGTGGGQAATGQT